MPQRDLPIQNSKMDILFSQNTCFTERRASVNYGVHNWQKSNAKSITLWPESRYAHVKSFKHQIDPTTFVKKNITIKQNLSLFPSNDKWNMEQHRR